MVLSFSMVIPFLETIELRSIDPRSIDPRSIVYRYSTPFFSRRQQLFQNFIIDICPKQAYA